MEKAPEAFRTIGEVSELLETPAHVLRFWESRFPQIKPVKRTGGRRYYRPSDVALLAGLQVLLHERGLTIKGAQKVLREEGVRHVIGIGEARIGQPIAPPKPDVADVLAEIETVQPQPEPLPPLAPVIPLRRPDAVQADLFADPAGPEPMAETVADQDWRRDGFSALEPQDDRPEAPEDQAGAPVPDSDADWPETPDSPAISTGDMPQEDAVAASPETDPEDAPAPEADAGTSAPPVLTDTLPEVMPEDAAVADETTPPDQPADDSVAAFVMPVFAAPRPVLPDLPADLPPPDALPLAQRLRAQPGPMPDPDRLRALRARLVDLRNRMARASGHRSPV